MKDHVKISHLTKFHALRANRNQVRDLETWFKIHTNVSNVVCSVVCILNWPLPIGAFQDQYKQTMINKYSNEHNHVKNPNWQEADQLAIYKRSREVELGATENNIS